MLPELKSKTFFAAPKIIRYPQGAGIDAANKERIRAAQMNSIVGLFTDVLPAGGVQRAGRHVAAVAAKFASDRGMSVRFLSLNDPRGLHTVRVGSLEFSASGYAGSKIQFSRAALRAAGRKPSLVIALHPHLDHMV